MCRNRYTLFIFLCFLLFNGLREVRSQPVPFLDDSVTYVWPTDASGYLSSTFAETRSAHLHAGLDIRTWGREGYRVFATRDAVVYRIGMSAYGYGNVIYLKHQDGSFSVYAHLNRFEPRLQAYGDSLRFNNYSSNLDRIIEDEGITYKQGELIGFTGSTGIGPPHLHYELRTPAFEPFNPLLTNLSVTDHIPPVFSQLGVEFLSSRDLKPEGHRIYSARNTGNGYTFGEITVSGPVGLSVNVHDRANDTPNIYAVYSLAMIHESDTLFHSKADYFSYDNTRHMFLDRSYPILTETRRGFQRLFVVNGNELPVYQKLKNRGVLNLPDGSYPIRIIAADIYGNEQSADVMLHVRESARYPEEEITYVPTYPVPPVEDGSAAVRPMEISLPENSSLLTLGNSTHKTLTFVRDASFWSGSGSTIEATLHPGRRYLLTTPDQRLWLEIPERALFDTLRLRIEVTAENDEINFSFSPGRLPLNEPLRFNYIVPESFRDNGRPVLFTVDRPRNRQYYLSSSGSDRVLRASLREIIDLKISRDNDPPVVGTPRLERNLAGNRLVVLPSRDRLTGIDYPGSIISVNGVRGIVEYDPSRSILIYYHPDFRPADRNVVEYEVFDGAGNETARSVGF